MLKKTCYKKGMELMNLSTTNSPEWMNYAYSDSPAISTLSMYILSLFALA